MGEEDMVPVLKRGQGKGWTLGCQSDDRAGDRHQRARCVPSLTEHRTLAFQWQGRDEKGKQKQET